MKILSILGWVMLLGVLVAIGASLPDIMRYLRMKAM